MTWPRLCHVSDAVYHGHDRERLAAVLVGCRLDGLVFVPSTRMCPLPNADPVIRAQEFAEWCNPAQTICLL